MRTKELSALALAIATCFPCSALGFDAEFELAAEPASQPSPDRRETEPLPALGSGVSAAALIAAGLAAAALAGGGGRGGGGEASGGGGGESGASNPSRTLSYTSATDFQTSEYSAQQGLRVVKAESLYYNGHYRWYMGDASDPAAGTGIGVKIAVADTGINAREASTASVIAIDGVGSYDYVNNRAGSAADDYGHGTHVAGIIAAPRNGEGMHGLAYNASVVNFKVGNSSGLITASDAQLADMMYRASNAGAMIINNSWASGSSITSFTAEQLQASMPRMIEASRAYIATGGVVVFAAGNAAASQPAVEPGLPHRITGIQPGWLAVVAIDSSGTLASYSNRCGVAAAWCLAAPGGGPEGGLYSMYNNGAYASMSGTSMAAPHAAAALGALKSMFPNLSYLQIRDRLLYTANRSGTYADASAYGQGLMDLGVASSPVGGVAVPTGSSANGPTAPVPESGIEFQAGALRALRMQAWVLVVDNYQRAPFWVPAQTFFREAMPRLMERQWASLRSGARSRVGKSGSLSFSHSPGLNNVVSADLASYRFGFSTGAGGEAILGSHLELAWLPHLAAPAVDSVALGYASHLGSIRIGLLGTLPTPQATSGPSLESSNLGSRRALGVIAQHRAAGTTYGVSLAIADDFERPIGIATSGAFGIGDSAAVSSGTFVQQSIGGNTVLKASLEVARHRPDANGALSAPGYAVRTANFGARTTLGAKTTLSAGLKREWSGSEAVRLHVPLTITENGDIGRVTYRLPYDDLVGRTAFTLRLDHELTRQVDLRAGLTRERYGFGASVTGIAAVVEIVN
jgi:subtilisin family serine protease